MVSEPKPNRAQSFSFHFVIQYSFARMAEKYKRHNAVVVEGGGASASGHAADSLE